MYQVTLKYCKDTVTAQASNFVDARVEAWLKMCEIALIYYNPDRDAQIAIDACRKGTRMYCKILGGNK